MTTPSLARASTLVPIPIPQPANECGRSHELGVCDLGTPGFSWLPLATTPDFQAHEITLRDGLEIVTFICPIDVGEVLPVSFLEHGFVDDRALGNRRNTSRTLRSVNVRASLGAVSNSKFLLEYPAVAQGNTRPI